ncbi:MAG: hypothetical protein NC347_13365 [Clostridium sp.]|nr:hypothetical protein [Clostridium sp.]
MIAYKFAKSRKWVQVLSDGRWRSVPFGLTAIDEINSMLSYADFDTFKKMYANQISPYMLSGYKTESAKKLVEEISANIQNEEKMKEMFESCQNHYDCIKDFSSYLADILPCIHKCRKNQPSILQEIYDNAFDLAFRFYNEISFDAKKELVENCPDKYKNLVLPCQWYGMEVCNNEYTDGKEEIAEKYYIPVSEKANMPENAYTWLMFPLDFAELLLNRDVNFIVKRCSNCGGLYATSYPQSVLCECCKSNNVTNTARKNNRCRQLHKNILDLINNCKTEKHIARYAGLEAPDGTPTYFFRTESNFYWSICQGKKPKTEKAVFYEDITNEKQYYEWLQKIHDEIKE